MKISDQIVVGVRWIDSKEIYCVRLKNGDLFEFDNENFKQVMKDIDNGKIDVDVNWCRME